MYKFINILCIFLTFSINAKAENKIKQILPEKTVIIIPTSTKTYICEKYTIISSDHCKLIENFFNSVYRND